MRSPQLELFDRVPFPFGLRALTKARKALGLPHQPANASGMKRHAAATTYNATVEELLPWLESLPRVDGAPPALGVRLFG